MLLVAAFNPITAKSGSFAAQTLQAGCAILVHNKTYVDVLFKVGQGDTFLVLANEKRKLLFNSTNAQPNPVIQWSQENIDYPQTVNQLENVCYVEIYQPDEIPDETYPVGIVREPVPNLIPYNIGHGLYGTPVVTPTSSQIITIWPSSYIGLSVAPTSVGGLGYDHFYSLWYSSGGLLDIPAGYTATGKTANNGTINNSALQSTIPGPFSQPGLTPVDSATQLSNTFYTLTSTIPFAQANGFWVDGWVYITQYTGQYIISDNILGGTTGISVFLNSVGNLQFSVGDNAGTTISSPNPVPLNQWFYFQAVYNGSALNTIELWINGIQVVTHTTTSVLTNSVSIPRIGTRPGGASGFTGSIANLGIALNQRPGASLNGTNQALASARYEQGLQSLNTDYQNAWVTRIEMDASSVAALAALTTVTLQTYFDPAGLLYVLTPAAADNLHAYTGSTNSSRYQFGQFAALQEQEKDVVFPNPITHFNDKFITFIFAVSTGTAFPSIAFRVNGYNILGVQ